jgi:hypothetical protein
MSVMATSGAAALEARRKVRLSLLRAPPAGNENDRCGGIAVVKSTACGVATLPQIRLSSSFAEIYKMLIRLTLAASALALAGLAPPAQAAETMGQAASSAAKKTGHAVAETSREVGHTVAEGGRKTGHAVAEGGREVGHGTAEAAREAGHGMAEAGRKTGEATKKEAHKAKAAVKPASVS